ncbi:MAG TPA: O-antigen ligase family protein [Sedimenticola thiotaurini]|uniref:O-antigen ligase family protein n=1 Tax=Sedimenticola thiotaurini TaxID=1543721 RepID=A0A831RR14_9GAMM|nr:O-antigen ligase family protein [Sedimenticola thiotaurini]
MPHSDSLFRSRLRHWPWPVLLVWSVLLLLPFGRSAELPGALMAVAAMVLWRQGRLSPVAGRCRAFTIAFLLIWVPMLLSLPDAVTPAEAGRVTLLYLRFYFAGLFIVWAIDSRGKRNLLLRLTGLLLLFWAADALLQFSIGRDLFGYPAGTRLNGLFGRHLRLGIVLAILSPLLFGWSLERLPRWIVPIPFIAALFVVVASGSRASWIMFTVILVAYGVPFLRARRGQALVVAVVILFLLATAATLSYRLFPTIASRIDTTLLLFSGDEAKVDQALAYRLPIWRTAVSMLEDNPVNGVGVRDFRNAYDHYAGPDDFYLKQGRRPTHPHQYLLEIGAEAGSIGLLGLLLLYGLLLRQWRAASPPQRRLAWPVAVAMLAMWFPFNTHLAFYSSFMGQLVWWLTALYLALISTGGSGDERTR